MVVTLNAGSVTVKEDPETATVPAATGLIWVCAWADAAVI